MLAGTCVVACGTAGEETGGVEAFEGALWEGGGCAVGGGLGEGGGGEEGGGEEEDGDGDEEGEMGGENGHFVLFFWGVDVGGNVGVGGLLMRWRGCVRDAFLLYALARIYIWVEDS